MDLLMASVGASEDHVSGLRAEGVLAVRVGGDDSSESGKDRPLAMPTPALLN
jgi:hypothetical protein